MEGQGKKEKLRNENRCGAETIRADLVGEERKGKRGSQMAGKTGKGREEKKEKGRKGKKRRDKKMNGKERFERGV